MLGYEPRTNIATEIDRRRDLSYDAFAAEYLHASKPVIITDALSRWKALDRWTPEFFRREFGEMKFVVNGREAGQEKYSGGDVREYTMAEFVGAVLVSTNECPAPYFRNKVLRDVFPSLVKDIDPLPEYCYPNWLPESYVVKHVRTVLNRGAAIEIYIGGKGSAFPVLHYDGAGTHAFLMQIYGRKQFIVFSPDQERYLYPSPEKLNLSLIDSVENPDLGRFPLFAKAVPTTFTLEPGEMLFVPAHWWHTTKMLTPSITISANVLNQSNWQELVEFVTRRQHNPFVSLASRIYLTAAGARRSWRDRGWQPRTRAVN
jgi:histone arginine demethylase JMJD6